MRYACWRKCDFQVHSPRDPNWEGDRPIGKDAASIEDVDAKRAHWANHFIDQCIAKKLGAVALTDHHEMTMVPYVQRAIEVRMKSDPNFDLWFFPAMELTARGGKQCIIIFDSDLSEEWRKQAQGKLGIVFADFDQKDAVAPKVTQLVCSYPDIAGLLDQLDGLRGKYIVLPNVSQGNSHTVLTDGAHADFSRMPYVGAYLDRNQTINTLTPKNQRRLSGEDRVWSRRRIYPLPTSDSRSADFRALGRNDAWIKIAEPTAEAIRQAFLGHQSRIRIERPELASIVVTKVEIEGSAILQNTVLSLSSESNAIIGGRGSGKSTFLEYLAFALGRSCYDMPRDHYSGTQRMKDLIEDSFTSGDGLISVELLMDSARFRIVRGPDSQYQPKVTYPNNSTHAVGSIELRRLFPAVVYSQGELADIGRKGTKETQLSDLLQFVSPEYKRMDDQLNVEVEAAKDAVKTEVQAVTGSWKLQSKLRKLTIDRESLKQRANELEKTLPKPSQNAQAILDQFSKMSEFNDKLIQASRHADQILQRLNSFDIELRLERDLSTDLEGTAKNVQDTYRDLYKALDSGISELRKGLLEKHGALAAAESVWKKEFKEVLAQRNSVLQQVGSQKEVTSQIINLRQKITDLTNQIGSLEEQNRVEGDPSERLATALANLRQINDERNKRTQEWAETIETLSNKKIRASVKPAANTVEIRQSVEHIAAKTGSHETTRANTLDEAVKNGTVSDFVDGLLTDCLNLLKWREMGASHGDVRPDCIQLMKVLGGTEHIQTRISQLMDISRVEAIATAVVKPGIDLHYFDGSRKISFEKASDGQRAAALLFMLLEQPGGPLIIDQPEGDLDNRIITELTDKLHEAKQKRQLIFASHNANLVVNGSAELVGHLDVNERGERQFASTGAIDRPDVCKVITSTMEGGEKAFKDRQDKYGY